MLQTAGCVLSLWVACVYGISRPPNITQQPNFNVFYKPGDTVELPCTGNGEPPPAFTWTRNQLDFNPSGNDKRVSQLSASGTLVFNSPEEKDEGIFQCSAKNDFGVATSINVNMRVAKMLQFDKKPDTKHTPVLGMPFTLPCVPPESVPKAQVFWIIKDEFGGFDSLSYNGRVTMDREYSLQFVNIEEQDDQNGLPYACMAVNNVMRVNAQGPLHYITVTGNTAGYQQVRYMWSDQDDRFGLRGQTLSIKCIFSGNPTPEVHWERPGNKSLTLRHKIESFSQELLIVDLQYEDSGSYECWADNIVGKRVTRTFNIRVNSKPTFLQRPESVETGIGATVQFHCRAEGDPPPDIRWFINGIKLADSTDPRKNSDRFKTLGGNTIQMERVEQTDYMVFQCNASNIHGYVFANAYLNVLTEAPEIIRPPKDLLVSAEGVPVDLTCRTTGKPDPIITWYKDGVQVTGGRYQILSNGDLSIDSLVLADAGHYICEARNIYNTTSREGILVVRRKTRIEQKPGDLERSAGQDAKFTCSGTTDPEEVDNLRIVWLKDGKETANDERTMTNFQDNSLTISGTNTRDSGTYTCIATNGLDSAKASAVLTVKDKPSRPLNVEHRDCHKDVTIQWMPGSYNMAPIQYYVLQYNTSFNPNQWNFGMKVNSTINKVDMTLSPYVNYTFRVIAYNKIGPSDPSSHTPNVCTTKSERPYYHPKNLRTIGNHKNTLFIEWTPIPEIQHNAPGFYYQLQILRDGDPDTDKDIVDIDDWRQNTYEKPTGRVYERYEITIKAQNNLGPAAEDPPKIIGHSYESTPDIWPTNFIVLTIEATRVEFQWDFDIREIEKVGTRIRGEFRGFKIQFWQENYQALTIRESDIGPEIFYTRNTTGNTFKAYVRDMLPNTPMMARISVMNNFYVGKPTESIRFHTTPGFPGPVDYFRILNIGDTHVNLEWGSPVENRGDLLGYDISYQLVKGLDLGEMQDREPQINDPFTTNAYLSGLSPRKKYRVHIFARTRSGRGEGYFIEFVTSKPTIPRMPRFRVMNVGNHYINISWWINAYATSGAVVFVEYRKLDGAEWLRSTDEVVNTWKNISNLEPGTTYEVRIKATNGARSVASSIAEVTTEGTAVAYALIGNIGWFLGMLFSILFLIGIIVLFFLCYRRGFRLDTRGETNYANNSSAAYSDTARMDSGSDNFGKEPKGYNNDYYDDQDYHDYDPPSYANHSGQDDKKGPPPEDYEDYNRKPSRDYDDDYDKKYPSAPAADYYGDNRDYDSRNDGYYGHDDGYYDRRDDGYYGRQDDYYDRRDDNYYGRDRDDYYDRRDDGYDRRDDGYDRRDDGYDRRDDRYDHERHNGRGRGYDYDSDEPHRRTSSSHAGNGNPSSTAV